MDVLQLVLTVALGFIVGIAVLIGVIFLLVRWWLKRKLSGIVDGIVGAAEDGGLNFPQMLTPPRLHLQAQENIAWRHGEAIMGAQEALEKRGFLSVGDFAAPELPMVPMRVLHDAAARYYAVIYDHAMLPAPFIDLHARLGDDATVTVTSAPQGDEIQIRPGHIKIYEKNAAPDALIDRMERELAGREIVGASKEAFVAEFEHSYAESMDFLLSRGGPSADEIRRGAQMRGEVVDETTISAVHEAQQRQNALQIEGLVREKFLAESTLSASEWEEVRDSLLIVHDRDTPDLLVAKWWQLQEENPFDEDSDDEIDYQARENELKSRLSGLPPRQAFERLVTELPAAARLRILGHIAAPVPADIYAAPSNL